MWFCVCVCGICVAVEYMVECVIVCLCGCGVFVCDFGSFRNFLGFLVFSFE